MTWAGKQGFQTPIANDSFLVDGVGALGTSHTERGLTYVEVELSGHMYETFSYFKTSSVLILISQGATIFARCCVPDYAVFDGFQVNSLTNCMFYSNMTFKRFIVQINT
jgi:hypothetical protein